MCSIYNMKEITDEKRAHYTFSLTDKQIHEFEAWRNEIWRTDKRSPGAIGGTFSFEFIGTTIGTIVKAIYRDGEKVLELTNYDNL